LNNLEDLNLPPSEADTCRRLITPKIYEAGWVDDQIFEQKTFTDGRIIVVGDNVKRGRQKRADYILCYRRNFPLAIIEAKSISKNPSDGLQQAKDYASILGVKFAYSTNGEEIIEHDFFSGLDTEMDRFPSPDSLWLRYSQGERIDSFDETTKNVLLAPYQRISGKTPRYYQEIAINKVIQSVLEGKNRILLTMATGTGKTFVAFQIIWKLWSSRWNKDGAYRRPKVLYLADRNVLVDDPRIKDFAVLGDARHRIRGEAIKSREMYFSTYQSIAKDSSRPGLFREYSPDFFDFIIVDECHRGSARDESNWREILEYFKDAYQLGMTATPLRKENVNTYRYFGNPVYQYSLKQGIDDGFLSPYRVHRVVTSWDAAGWRPSRKELDRYGRLIPDKEYQTKDFERAVSLKMRTLAIAKHLTRFLNKTERLAKTIIFCVDQEHAEDMRRQLNNLNTDLVREYPDYVVRIVSDEGDTGRMHLSNFMELEKITPTLVTTSKLLSTGVDVPLCKNVVIFRVINSMVEFKQIIGRGTRIRDDYGKYFFNVIDYTGSATRLFADPDFDGFPTKLTEEEIDKEGETILSEESEQAEEEQGEIEQDAKPIVFIDFEEEKKPRRKYYVDGGSVDIAVDLVYELDADGRQLRVVKYTDYTAEKVRSMFTSAAELRSKWSDVDERAIILHQLEDRGITLEYLMEVANKPEADPFDLLCHYAFNAPIRTRVERAERLRKEEKHFFNRFKGEARNILEEILIKYIEFGFEQFDSTILKVPPISDYGNPMEISELFGGADQLRDVLLDMQNRLYAF